MRQPLELTGFRSGKVVAIRVHGRNAQGRINWFCQCDCGNTAIIRSSSLKSGKTTSCGHCLHNSPPELPQYPPALRTCLISKSTNYRRGAKYRDIVFKLTGEQSREYFLSPCFYCGLLPKLDQPITLNGIDRKDSSQGYLPDNCVACCAFCNFRKSNFHFDHFIDWIKQVHANLHKNGII